MPSREQHELCSQPLHGLYSSWEDALLSAQTIPLRLNDSSESAERWRANLDKVCLISNERADNIGCLLSMTDGNMARHTIPG